MMHFTSDETDQADKILKICRIIEYFLECFQTVYRPGPNISIDESLMQWQGRLSFKQFTRNKKTRYGIKFYEVCDTENGYVYNFKIYTGKDTSTQQKRSFIGVSGKVVLDMLGDLGKQSRSLYIDNWYSSPWLFKRLHDEKTNVWTVKINRMYMPKLSNKLKEGQMKIFSTPQMCFMAWKDKRLVTMLSTMHSPQMITTDKIDYRTGETEVKPNIVVSYNKNMGRVNLLDQTICPYRTPRKSIKWYIKTYFHLLDIAIFNALVVYNIIHPT
ncbi:LOW QUALITY PROTEIN: piggyBac transposable element-derived protein 4-like [Cardiocondyla obscurior]|uniref:LOW QUALITY PROTEIN: piggyBac transposable element-derived protein 4-like n=1 Tax=Cardiocondyla obscurior TaxID=286306 RepID=UPI0039658C63